MKGEIWVTTAWLQTKSKTRRNPRQSKISPIHSEKQNSPAPMRHVLKTLAQCTSLSLQTPTEWDHLNIRTLFLYVQEGIKYFNSSLPSTHKTSALPEQLSGFTSKSSSTDCNTLLFMLFNSTDTARVKGWIVRSKKHPAIRSLATASEVGALVCIWRGHLPNRCQGQTTSST